MTNLTDGGHVGQRFDLRDPATLLVAWELAGQAPPPARAAVLVHRAGLIGSLDDALDLGVGTCAGLALQVYRDTFGDVAEAVVVCPGCGERMEAALSTDAAPDAASDGNCRGEPERVVGAWRVRTPTARDLLLVGERAGRDGPVAARDELVRRCVRPVGVRGVDAADLATAELEAIEAAAEELAGAAALVGVVTCSGCGSAVEASFDAGALLWDRVAAAAPELLADVASLARAFGWSETEVLALSPERRRTYLALADR